jgi:hypothetical protein
MKGTLPLADAVNVARHALKRGQQAEHNVENSFLLLRKMLHTNGFRLSVHFYIVLPATLIIREGFRPQLVMSCRSASERRAA